jgi:hypothetical protein
VAESEESEIEGLKSAQIKSLQSVTGTAILRDQLNTDTSE